MAAVGGEQRIVRLLLQREHPPQHVFPFNCGPCKLAPWRPGACYCPQTQGLPMAGFGFLTKCKNGVLSYVVLRLLCTITALFAQWGGVYCESELHMDCAWPYIALITNFSQCWALYCLVMLYHELNEELAPFDPLPKFLSVKLVGPIAARPIQRSLLRAAVHAGGVLLFLASCCHCNTGTFRSHQREPGLA